MLKIKKRKKAEGTEAHLLALEGMMVEVEATQLPRRHKETTVLEGNGSEEAVAMMAGLAVR